MAYNLLKGKRGIIFGALDEKSIAWKVAERAHEEGAVFTFNQYTHSYEIWRTQRAGRKMQRHHHSC